MCDCCWCAQTAELMRQLREIVTLVYARYVQRRAPTCEEADAPQGPAKRKRKRASGGEPPACQQVLSKVSLCDGRCLAIRDTHVP